MCSCLCAHVWLERGEQLPVDWLVPRSPGYEPVAPEECVVGGLLAEVQGLLLVPGRDNGSWGRGGVGDEELSVDSGVHEGPGAQADRGRLRDLSAHWLKQVGRVVPLGAGHALKLAPYLRGPLSPAGRRATGRSGEAVGPVVATGSAVVELTCGEYEGGGQVDGAGGRAV